MSKSTELSPEQLQRYKKYPLSHYSRWRFYVHLLTLRLLVVPIFYIKCHPKFYGRENVPKQGPFLVAANHISMADPPLVAAALDYPTAFMAKKELFNNFWLAEFFYLQGIFALDRESPDTTTLKSALNALRSPAKWALCLFPEGTRSTTGHVLPFKKGIGALAQKTGVPVLPVGIYKDEKGRHILTIGKLITDVSNAEEVQQKAYEAIVHLADPNWKR